MPDLPKIKTETLNYAPRPTWRERLSGYLPNGEQVMQFLRTLVWVTPLTLLIWIYAEREQTVRVPNVTVSVDVKTLDHNRMVTLRRPPDKNIILELAGPRAKVDQVQEELKPTDKGAAVQIFVDPQIGLGGQELLTVGQINNHPVFKRNGVTVKSAQPPYLFVDIDQYEEVDAVVEAPPEVKALLDNARFVPDTVKLRVPSQLLRRAEGESKDPLAVYADLAKRAELKGRTGKVDLENVPVYWKHRENVTLTPAVVRANLVVKQSSAQHTIPSVPVVKETPKGLDDTYRVVYEGAVQNVVVTGPAEAIEEIRTGRHKVRARLEIQALTAPNKDHTAALEFTLPTGVHLTPETADRTSKWKYRLEDR